MEKLKSVIDNEMLFIGGQKVALAKIVPRENWERTGRWKQMGNELIRFNDRNGDDFCLAATHEEVITNLISEESFNSNSLPMLFYQIGEKYRDEIRPRFGLLRAKEFVMKDLYSFDTCEESAIKTYYRVMEAYKRIFEILEIPYSLSEADSGNIGGNLSHEFHAISDSGEDNILYCSCGKYSNVEKAISTRNIPLEIGESEMFSDVFSLIKSERDWNNNNLDIDINSRDKRNDYCDKNLKVEKNENDFKNHLNPLKALLFRDKSVLCVVILSGSDEINELLVRTALNLSCEYTCEKLDCSKLEEFLELPVEKRRIILDSALIPIDKDSLKTKKWLESLYSTLKNISPEGLIVRPIKVAKVGELCPEHPGNSPDSKNYLLKARKGIEIGHLFYLGKKYSLPLGATYSGINGEERVMEMGCYGIGVSRILSAIVEITNDIKGIRWPLALVPFRLAVIPTSKMFTNTAEDLIVCLIEKYAIDGSDIVLDDRDDTKGFKIIQSQSIGIPVSLIVGNNYVNEGLFEFETRNGENLKFSEGDEAIDEFLGELFK